MRHLKRSSAIALAILLPYFVPAQCDRSMMVDQYQKSYLGSNLSLQELDWTGDQLKCLSGDVSTLAINRSLMRLNYFRQLAGLQTKVGHDTSLTKMCQEAALMMHSQNDLSHNPDSNWSCWTSDGKKAAGRSNLALGAHSVKAIDLYMRDPGTNNTAVGHRRWILYSRAKDFGIGTTSRAHALYVINNKIPPPDNLDYVAYPSPGYFPAPLLPERWSISIPSAKFDLTTVNMSNEDGLEIPLDLLMVKNGFGDNTLVWEPKDDQVTRFSEFDLTFHINVNNVIVSGDTLDYTYAVTIASPIHPPACPEDQIWAEESCACLTQQTTSDKEVATIDPQAFNMFPNPARDYFFIDIENLNSLPPRYTIATILNSTGQTLKAIHLRDQVTRIDLNDIPDGFYICRLANDEGVLTKMLVVRH